MHFVGYCHLSHLAGQPGSSRIQLHAWYAPALPLSVAKYELGASWRLPHGNRTHRREDLVSLQDSSPFTSMIVIHWVTEFAFCFLFNVSVSILHGIYNLKQAVSFKAQKYFQAAERPASVIFKEKQIVSRVVSFRRTEMVFLYWNRGTDLISYNHKKNIWFLRKPGFTHAL